jgi:hypothetical protein
MEKMSPLRGLADGALLCGVFSLLTPLVLGVVMLTSYFTYMDRSFGFGGFIDGVMCCGVPLCLVMAGAAIILGVIVMKKLANVPDATARGHAIVGIVTGSLGVIIYTSLLILNILVLLKVVANP